MQENLMRLEHLEDRNGVENLSAIDGPPGTGKTTEILARANKWSKKGAIITFTVAAADVLKGRMDDGDYADIGTIYKLSWGPVSRLTGAKSYRGQRSSGPWLKRKITGSYDTALHEYEEGAPSRRPPSDYGEVAKKLHAWDGEGSPPFDLSKLRPDKELRYVLPLAKWVEAGCPSEVTERYPDILVDEAQDMSSLEMAATLGLSDGEVTAFLDPGQSVFANAKGINEELPPAWTSASKRYRLNGGFRVGNPVAETASSVLSSYFNRSAETFAHPSRKTEAIPWDPETGPPPRGLVLGYSRSSVKSWFEKWDLGNTGVIPATGDPSKELVMSTIHSAKGSEAPEVYLLPWSNQALNKLDLREPNELRVLYVALTRAINCCSVSRTLFARLGLL